MHRIAIIGGGPAGFMSAAAAAGSGRAAVAIFDAGAPLATLLRTGGGRCNLTNALRDPRELAAQYPRGGRFLLPCFTRFGSSDAMEWFRSRGLALTEEEEGRIFPRSGRAADVRDILAEEARTLGVRVHARAPVTRAEKTADGFVLESPRGREAFDRLIIATGGDWRDGGGCGYRPARALGHSITHLAPSLTALVSAESWPGSVAGLTLKGVRLSARFEGKQVARETGDLLFTHDGITGPLVFRVSSRCAFLGISRDSPLLVELSVKPDMNRERTEETLRAALTEQPRGHVLTALRSMAPRSLADVVLRLSGVDPDLSCSQLPREKRKALAAMLDRLPLAIVDRKKGGEMVTAGGVELTEVEGRTMESRLVPGLHFCGEVLDIDGFTGGYNLQAAWTTGWLAGLAARP